MYEVEVKAKLKDRQAVMKKLEDFGCKFSEELHQVDRVYFPEGFVFPPPIGTGILRVRKQNDKYFFTLKISQSGRQDSIEREMEITDGEMMIEIIKLLKYQEAPTVDKKRIKTKYKDMIIELDLVKELGEFIEVEKIVTHPDPEDRKKIQKELCEFLETLGVVKEDLLVNAKYDIMLFEKQQGK
jgi:predicted adenylyl cyclase CyaB